MRAGVYQITCVPTGKFYVGSSRRIDDRRSTHFSTLRRGAHPNTHLQRAFRKYGEAAFDFSVLEECSPDTVIEREQHYFDTLVPFGQRGFNARLRAELGAGVSLDDKTIEQMSRSQKRRVRTETEIASLRSQSVKNAARLRALTHCRRGHEFTEANTYWTCQGYRRCRKCHAASQLAPNARRRQAARADA